MNTESVDSQYLDDWAISILSDPITKEPCSVDIFKVVRGIIDARVFMKNTFGYSDWEIGQDAYEVWEASGTGYKNEVMQYKKEIAYDRPIYDNFKLKGDILDVGGGTGTVREFLDRDARYISVDPFIDAVFKIPKAKIEAYKCLNEKFNFVGSLAEFIPFRSKSFDWVHMRSMLDHVQVPDLALKEAYRVLKPNGSLLIGLSVEGGKTGRKPLIHVMKDVVKASLELFGIDKYKDHHTWHPTYKNLIKLITDNGFKVQESFWQPYWKDQVVYVLAHKE